MTDDNLNISRRRFVQTSGLTVASLAATSVLPAGSFHVAGREDLKVGLIGCGGRGSGAAVNALMADPAARLVAVADLFEDRIEASLKRLAGTEVAERVQVDAEHRFVGFDAYQSVIDACDVVLLASPPHFRPRHLRAAIEADRHVFCEKPVAVDAPGLRSVIETCKLATRKGLSIVSGLCYRYDEPKQQLIARIHEGAIGEITALESTYHTGCRWPSQTSEELPPLELQLRNWPYYSWLSGDLIVEQSIHGLDKILWAMGDEPPKSVAASGGRAAQIGPEFGDVYDHFDSVFVWGNGVKLHHSCRQWEGSDRDISDFVHGTEGTAAIQGQVIKGAEEWRFDGRAESMFQRELNALFGSIRDGLPINDHDHMCKATLMALMARMSAYTGRTISWDQALASDQLLGPDSYEWDQAPVVEVPVPGLTEFF